MFNVSVLKSTAATASARQLRCYFAQRSGRATQVSRARAPAPHSRCHTVLLLRNAGTAGRAATNRHWRRGFVRAGVSQRWPGVAGTSHGNVDVLGNFAGRDATRAVGGVDEIVTFLAGVFAANGVDEGQRRVKLLGGDQEARAIGCPFTDHVFHKAPPSGEEGGCEFRLP